MLAYVFGYISFYALGVNCYAYYSFGYYLLLHIPINLLRLLINFVLFTYALFSNLKVLHGYYLMIFF